MHIQSDRALIPAGSTSTRYLSVTISAPASTPAAKGPASRARRPGVSVSLVLDRSGSMGGNKIALARQAVAHAIRLLKDQDQLSVIVYDDEVETVLERGSATKGTRRQALAALAQVDARGSTNLSGGWFTGAASLGAAPGIPGDSGTGGEPTLEPGKGQPTQSTPDPGGVDRVRRVFLLTDGLANQGVVDPTALQAAAARFRAQGISTSTFGLGADFDEELLTSLASRGGGHFYFIEQPQQIPDFLASELGEVLEVVARDVVFEMTAGEGASIVLLNGLPVEQVGAEANRGARVRLGDFVAEQEMTLILAVTISAHTEGQSAVVDCRVRDRGGVLFAEPMRVEWSAVPAERDRQQPVNRAVLLEVARMLAERARVVALAANRKGEFKQAGLALDAAIQQIRTLGADQAAVQEIIDQLQGETQVFAEDLSPIDRKARHFASYALAYSREGGKARRRER